MRVSPGMTVGWRSVPCAQPLYLHAFAALVFVVLWQPKWCCTCVMVRVSRHHCGQTLYLSRWCRHFHWFQSKSVQHTRNRNKIPFHVVHTLKSVKFLQAEEQDTSWSSMNEENHENLNSCQTMWAVVLKTEFSFGNIQIPMKTLGDPTCTLVFALGFPNQNGNNRKHLQLHPEQTVPHRNLAQTTQIPQNNLKMGSTDP